MRQRKMQMEHGELKQMTSWGIGMKQEDIIKFVISQRLRWAAHVMGMENARTTRKITMDAI